MKLVANVLVAILTIAMLGSAFPVQAAAQTPNLSAEQELADRYAPVMYVRIQSQRCGTPPDEGEPYLPLPVEMVIGNDDVVIRDGENDDEIIATGPSAQELATFGRETYMDFPGDPRQPGCTYESDSRARIQEEGFVPTTYARVTFDPVNDRLALQYWFYWYFNDWNNTHESDWEGIQLVWDKVESVEDALEISPSRIGYAQHGNGEVAEWGDDKVQLEDRTHPIVYPAAGSHASFFSNDTFLAWGERNSGFGCDVSSPPSGRTPLDVVLIPAVVEPESEFAWLLYEGRWGEKQPGSFNGPRGPGFNSRWEEPFDQMDRWRPFSIVVPGSDALGPNMADAFCTITGAGSSLLLELMVRPWLSYPIAGGLLVALGYFIKTSMPLMMRAVSIYRNNMRLFLGIGLVSIPIGIMFNGLQAFFIGRQPLKFIVDWLNDTGGARLTAVMTIGGIQQLAMLMIVTPALVYAVQQVLHGNRMIAPEAYVGILDRARDISIAFVIFVAVIGLLLATAIGFPIAIWLAVKWHFFVQILVFDRTTRPTAALRQSFRIVRGSWIRTALALIVFDLIAVLPGILVGFGLLTIGRTAVGFANGMSSLLYAVLMPLSTIAVTLLFLDRQDQATKRDAEEDPEKAPSAEAETKPGYAL